MKINVEVDCTPEEARRALGLPDVTMLHDIYLDRAAELMRSGKLFTDIGLPPINPEHDRAMICGGPAMLDDTSTMLDEFGFKVSPRLGVAADYVIERAFVEK